MVKGNGKGRDNGQNEFDFTGGLPKPAREAIDDAMQRVDDHADEDWKAAWGKCLLDVAHKQLELTSDDVQDVYQAISDRPVTHNESAIGPLMKRAAVDGILTSTGRVVRSTKAIKHGIRHTVWKSNIYRGAA